MRPLLLSLSLFAAPLAAQELPTDPPGAGDVAVMGTIPIYWGERAEMADLLADGAGHWARPVIEESWRMRPLDYLSAAALSGHTRLLLAQPRGLAAEENVALDAFVRGGGRVLLFADPMLTAHSGFALGDRRRPQEVALLSPILSHWGLELRYDEGQGERIGDSVPPGFRVEQAGELVLRPGSGDCALFSQGIIAECLIGNGVVLIVADAALLDAEGADDAARTALAGLLQRIFGNRVPPPAPCCGIDQTYEIP